MMEQDNNLATDAVSDDIEKLSVGASLRAARVNLGLSVEDVVAKIKLAPRQIIALEADDFQALPETAFVRGFVRSYARLLQLDEQPLLDALPGAVSVAAELPRVDASYPSERSKHRQNLNLLIAALFMTFLIAGFAVFQVNSPDQVDQEESASDDAGLVSTELLLPDPAQIQDVAGVPEAAASAVFAVPAVSAVLAVMPSAASAPQVLTSAASSVLPAGRVAAPAASLRLVFDKEAWAEIKDKTGKTLLKQLNQAGSELSVDGSAPFVMVIGHATSVHLYYRGRPVDMTPYVSASSDVARLTLE